MHAWLGANHRVQPSSLRVELKPDAGYWSRPLKPHSWLVTMRQADQSYFTSACLQKNGIYRPVIFILDDKMNSLQMYSDPYLKLCTQQRTEGSERKGQR